MPKRKHGSSSRNAQPRKTPSWSEKQAAEASCLTDGVKLASFGKDDDDEVIMPWLGYGTYRLGKQQAQGAVLQALEVGYRAIDTAFIYGGETTERLVGQAVQKAIDKGILESRQEVFVTTKHWRKYHGYEPTLQCLKLSLKRLQLDYVDLWLMHWPGPAWTTMHRKKEVVQADPWHYAATDATEMASQRAETWQAMEDAVRRGLCRAIGVSNMTVDHLKTLKKTATMWPPAVNQVEFQYVHYSEYRLLIWSAHPLLTSCHRCTPSLLPRAAHYILSQSFWNIVKRKALSCKPTQAWVVKTLVNRLGRNCSEHHPAATQSWTCCIVSLWFGWRLSSVA